MNELILSTPLPLDRNPAAVYIASLGSPSGRRSQAQALRVISEIFHTAPDALDWSALRYQHTAMIRSQLSQSYAPATANKFISALKQVLKHAWLLGQMSADDYQRAIQLDPVHGETLPAGRELSTNELRSLLDACRRDTSPIGIRDTAIIALLYSTGLRREEIATLQLEDYSDGVLKITGKLNKQRTAHVVNGSLTALNAWLAIRGSTPGSLFLSIRKGGKISDGFKDAQAIWFILAKRAAEAGVTNISPHDFRRTFVSDLLDAGADIVTVSRMAGHSNVKTTARYDRRPEEAKKRAAQLLHIP